MPAPTLSAASSTRKPGVRPPKAAVLIADHLRRQIVTGQLKPGDKLQPESVLQSEFSISRPTMREALRLLESESLITIGRGKHGGARVMAIDLGAIASQVGVVLQIQGATLQDVWLARTVIEPPAAGLLAISRDRAALAALEANIAAARAAAHSDLIRYADLAAEFSLLITQHCGNRTLHVMASLIYDLIRRQHENVTERTSSKASVGRLRQESLRDRERAVALMRSGTPSAAESFWRAHLEHMRDLVLQAYPATTTIDVLTQAVGPTVPLGLVRRPSAAEKGQAALPDR